jgi:hypothetical protein
MSSLMRTCRFSPWRKGSGPRFILKLFDLGRGRVDRIGYELKMKFGDRTVVLFAGDDFRPSPLHAIDSDETVVGLMSFLTLQKGDTDAEYFRNYTPAQLEFSEQYAEALGCEVLARFEG